MNQIITFFLFIYSAGAIAQIANSSFFPSMRSINPGLSHLRESGFLSVELAKTTIERSQDVNGGGILDGINTEVNLEKTTFFRAGKGPGITLEFLYDQEVGERTESFETATYDRATTTEGKSSVIGGTLDIGFIGITVAKASYEYLLDFHVDEVPNLNRETHDTSLEYNLTRVGTAFQIKGISIGTFYSIQNAEGSVDSVLYDPTSGNPAPAEVSNLEYETISNGIGVGYKSKMYHLEISQETITNQSLDQSNTYLLDLYVPAKGSRTSFVAEVRFGKLGLGGRVRKTEGNFSDIEQLISSNMLNVNTSEDDTKLETSFNFSYGSPGGYSLSGFYTTSKSETEEVSEMIESTEKYDTITEITSYGVSLSYVY